MLLAQILTDRQQLECGASARVPSGSPKPPTAWRRLVDIAVERFQRLVLLRLRPLGAIARIILEVLGQRRARSASERLLLPGAPFFLGRLIQLTEQLILGGNLFAHLPPLLELALASGNFQARLVGVVEEREELVIFAWW